MRESEEFPQTKIPSAQTVFSETTASVFNTNAYILRPVKPFFSGIIQKNSDPCFGDRTQLFMRDYRFQMFF
jgi:hypothetical protein